MRHLLTALSTALLLAAAPPAAADAQIDAYFVELGPQDFYNSRGQRLTTGPQIFQQDRANFHRFGIRHGGDSSDRVFSSREQRARMPGLFTRALDQDLLARIARMDPATAARPGFADYLVIVCGQGGQVSRLILAYADADGHPGC